MHEAPLFLKCCFRICDWSCWWTGCMITLTDWVMGICAFLFAIRHSDSIEIPIRIDCVFLYSVCFLIMVFLVCAKTNIHINGHIGPENVFETCLPIDIMVGPSYWIRLTTLTPHQKERVTHVLRIWRWTYMVCSVCRDLFPTWDYVQLIRELYFFLCFPMFDIMGFRKEWRLIVPQWEACNGVITFYEHFTIHLSVKATRK